LEVKGGSDRSFGWVLFSFFLIVGFIPLRHAQPVHRWALALSGVLFIVTLIKPALLHPFNLIWTRLGVLLGRLVTPVLLGLLFFLVITPIGWLMRRMGKQALRLHPDAEAGSYWIHRPPPALASESMINQF
jgi:hypothetical protein